MRSKNLISYFGRFCALATVGLVLAFVMGSESKVHGGLDDQAGFEEFCRDGVADTALSLDRTKSLDEDQRDEVGDFGNDLGNALLGPADGSTVGAAVFGGSTDHLAFGPPALIIQGLTTDSGNLNSAIDLAMANGSSIFIGTDISAALAKGKEILDAGTSLNQFIVLVSDGQANKPDGGDGPQQAALDEADSIKGMGIQIFTVLVTEEAAAEGADEEDGAQAEDLGLSPEELMMMISSGDGFFYMVSTEDLNEIVEQIRAIIAEVVDCGEGTECTNVECVDNACVESDKPNGTTCQDDCPNGGLCQEGDCVCQGDDDDDDMGDDDDDDDNGGGGFTPGSGTDLEGSGEVFTCSMNKLIATTTPLQAILGILFLGMVPWLFRRSLREIRIRKN